MTREELLDEPCSMGAARGPWRGIHRLTRPHWPGASCWRCHKTWGGPDNDLVPTWLPKAAES